MFTHTIFLLTFITKNYILLQKLIKMNEICEIVLFQKENNKINVCGYLMVQESI